MQTINDKQIIENVINELEETFNKQILEYMISSYNEECKNMKNCKNDTFGLTFSNIGLTFSKIIDKYDDVPNTQWKIWKYQEHLNFHAMRFLDKNPDLLNKYQDIKVPYELIGLMFASGSCACLKIEEIPQLLDWNINEYDGIENVIII